MQEGQRRWTLKGASVASPRVIADVIASWAVAASDSPKPSQEASSARALSPVLQAPGLVFDVDAGDDSWLRCFSAYGQSSVEFFVMFMDALFGPLGMPPVSYVGVALIRGPVARTQRHEPTRMLLALLRLLLQL